MGRLARVFVASNYSTLPSQPYLPTHTKERTPHGNGARLENRFLEKSALPLRDLYLFRQWRCEARMIRDGEGQWRGQWCYDTRQEVYSCYSP